MLELATQTLELQTQTLELATQTLELTTHSGSTDTCISKKNNKQ